MTQQPSRSVYHHAARNGLVMGGWLSAISLCFIFMLKVPQLSVAFYLLLLGVPLVASRLMGRFAASNPQMRRFAPLWLNGIYTFIFGSLICAAITAATMLISDPHYIRTYVAATVDGLRNSPYAADYSQQISVMDQAMQQNMLPSAMDFVFSMIWTTSFFGSMLSMLIAALMSARKQTVRESDT